MAGRKRRCGSPTFDDEGPRAALVHVRALQDRRGGLQVGPLNPTPRILCYGLFTVFCCLLCYRLPSLPTLRSAASWAAFARLEPFITAAIVADFGSNSAEWPDSIKTFHRDMWTGTFDLDITRVCNQLPAHFDSRQTEMTKA